MSLHRERLRTVLKYRAEASQTFETARSLGPQIFLGTIPAVLNALLVVFLGNIAVEDPVMKTKEGAQACYDTGVVVHLQGVIAGAYGLLAVLSLFLLGQQVTTRIRIPTLLLIGVLGYGCGWAFIGLGASIAGRETCLRAAPFTYAFSALQTGLTPLVSGVWLLRYFATTVQWAVGRIRAEALRLFRLCCTRRGVAGGTPGEQAGGAEAPGGPS